MFGFFKKHKKTEPFLCEKLAPKTKHIPLPVKYFPELIDVFGKNAAVYSQFLLPVATIELSEIDPSLNGSIHFVYPIEPWDGCVGEHTEQYHSTYCMRNWIGFKVSEGKYILDTDIKFFDKEYFKTNPLPEGGYMENYIEELDIHYEKRIKKYELCKTAFNEGLVEREEMDKFSQIGGKPIFGNWAVCTNYPLDVIPDNDNKFSEGYAYPTTPDGRRFIYIGELDGSCLGDFDSGVILFYDPKTKIALTTYHWS